MQPHRDTYWYQSDLSCRVVPLHIPPHQGLKRQRDRQVFQHPKCKAKTGKETINGWRLAPGETAALGKKKDSLPHSQGWRDVWFMLLCCMVRDKCKQQQASTMSPVIPRNGTDVPEWEKVRDDCFHYIHYTWVGINWNKKEGGLGSLRRGGELDRRRPSPRNQVQGYFII